MTNNTIHSLNVPKLRFREFQSEYRLNILNDLLKIKHGFPFDSESFSNSGDYVLLTPGNFYEEGGYKNRGENQKYYIGEIPTDYILKEGDMLIAMTEQAPGLLGSPILIPENGKFLHNQRLGLVQIKDEKEFSKQFLYFFLNTKKVRNSIFATASGTKVRHTSPDRIGGLNIKLPSLPEQQKIALFLSIIDEKIEKLKSKKSLIEKYKKGVMQKIFTRELRFRDENGEEFGEWKEKKLGEIGEIVTGKTPSTNDDSLWQGDIQFVTPTDISGFKYQTKTQRAVTRNLKMKILPPKSIMFTCIASIGKMSLSMNPCITNQQINSIIPYLDFDKEFIYYAILHISEYIKSTQSSNTLPIINKTEFSKFIIHVPEILEQQKIASFLSEIDKKIDAINTEIESTEKWKKGLLQGMFI